MAGVNHHIFLLKGNKIKRIEIVQRGRVVEGMLSTGLSRLVYSRNRAEDSELRTTVRNITTRHTHISNCLPLYNNKKRPKGL